ncbi:MAG TPA: T9SS type A sorting domain-containing protein [Candidatus Cloacimonetes bacterium]|nr:T9SS type A sorting domain-containing protein [Candidatus Cloacimonadota bacterium]
MKKLLLLIVTVTLATFLIAVPSLVQVPTQVPTIQEAIDLVADGGTVIVASGTYIVHELSWANKHIRLLGSGNPVLKSFNTHAIKLDWSGINNTDRIQGFTFQDCRGGFGPAIILLEGASPLVSNCTFQENMVEGPYDMTLNNPYGYGGAVFIQGGSNQSDSPRFENCTFTDNAAFNANGGGAVALFGPATFLSCTFTNNWTETAVGFGPPAYFAAGAILIYGDDYNGDILIHNCTFTGNYGQNYANDIWVAGSRGINNLTIDHCTFNPRTPPTSFYEPVIRIFYDNMPYFEDSTTDFVFTRNKFNLSGRGAVFFHDYAGCCRMKFNNNVVNGIEGDTYGLKLRYYGGFPHNPDYFQFNNNTLLNLTSSGLILFKGAYYTIENNVFHNCSPYGVRWGDHDGIPDHATESLTINNCFFNDLANHVDTQGNAYQEFSISSPVVAPDPLLDSCYQPIWNASTMSPCIDSGVGTDEDGTPADIGAIPAAEHQYEVYDMPVGSVSNGIKWMSFPVINHITSGYNLAQNFFGPIVHPDILDWVEWKPYGVPLPGRMLYSNTGDLIGGAHIMSSIQGYKVKVKQNVTEQLTLAVSGYRQAPHTVIPLKGNREENWIGYFCVESSSIMDAFSPIIDNIVSISTQYWSVSQIAPGFWLGNASGRVLNYGDMVIVKCIDDCSFSWNNSQPVVPRSKALPQEFTYTEKMSYTPVYISVGGGNNPNLPSEIGLYVNGVCKGAAVVDGPEIDICAYLDADEIITADNSQLVFFYPTKAAATQRSIYHIKEESLTQSKNGAEYYAIKISDLESAAPVSGFPVLMQNYPNPFNPSTTISYEIPDDGQVELNIYNVRGQLVKHLVNTHKAVGQHRVVWDGKDEQGRSCSSGVYYYRLKSHGVTHTQKMLMIK